MRNEVIEKAYNTWLGSLSERKYNNAELRGGFAAGYNAALRAVAEAEIKKQEEYFRRLMDEGFMFLKTTYDEKTGAFKNEYLTKDEVFNTPTKYSAVELYDNEIRRDGKVIYSGKYKHEDVDRILREASHDR